MALVEETRGDEVDYHRWNDQAERDETMILVFDVHVNKKVFNNNVKMFNTILKFCLPTPYFFSLNSMA